MHSCLYSAVLIYDFHIFTLSSSSVHEYITNPHNAHAHLACFAQVLRALHRHHRGQGFEPCTILDFFRLYVRNCLTCPITAMIRMICISILLFRSSSTVKPLLSGLPIKRTPFIEWTLSLVPKLVSL